MDPLIKKLNQRIATKIANQNLPSQNPQTQKLNFDEILQAKQNDAPKIEQIASNDSSMKAISADGIEIDMTNLSNDGTHEFSVKDRFMDLFGKMNQDMVSLDSSIEVLSDPNIKLSRRQLLAYQAGIGNMTINSELFSKLAQSVSQNLNTMLQTQV